MKESNPFCNGFILSVLMLFRFLKRGTFSFYQTNMFFVVLRAVYEIVNDYDSSMFLAVQFLSFVGEQKHHQLFAITTWLK